MSDETLDTIFGIFRAGLVVAILVAVIVLLVRLARDRPAGQPPPLPARDNTLFCPYCSAPVARDVRSVGQLMICPNCHGQLVAPGWWRFGFWTWLLCLGGTIIFLRVLYFFLRTIGL
jgi:hypothetical protein